VRLSQKSPYLQAQVSLFRVFFVIQPTVTVRLTLFFERFPFHFGKHFEKVARTRPFFEKPNQRLEPTSAGRMEM
jgi:hypothetical protein